MPSASPLSRVYIEALQGRATYVHAGLTWGPPSSKHRIAHIGFEPFRKKGLVAKLWFARAAHAELVMLRCVKDFRDVGAMRAGGWVDLPPAEVVAKIKATASLLGARWQTEAQIHADAEKVVAEIVARVEAARRNGTLQQVNADYKKYRIGQAEKGEPAIGYSAYLHNFTKLLVVRAAEKSMMQPR